MSRHLAFSHFRERPRSEDEPLHPAESVAVKGPMLKSPNSPERERELDAIRRSGSLELIQKGIDSYSRELPVLLGSDHRDKFVAYHGDRRVTVASSRQEMSRNLSDLGYADDSELFVGRVAPPDED